MDINVVLPTVGLTGGVRVVFEYANRLQKRNHNVRVIYPLIPSRVSENWYDFGILASKCFGAVKRIRKKIDWFDLKVDCYRIPSLSPQFADVTERFVPNADVTIATSWETAHFVSRLSPRKGKKSYFVQHYEIWDIWNSVECWNQVSSTTDSTEEYPIQMSEIEPPSKALSYRKGLVDDTYGLDINYVTISSWLERLLEEKFNQSVVATIFNSVNHETFYYDPSTKTKDEPMVLVPYRNTEWKGYNEAQDLLYSLEDRFPTVNIHAFAPTGNPHDLPNSVIWHEGVSDEELRQIYSDADIVAIPSWVEGFHLPPLEAMACKAAVVATNVGSIPDIAPHNERAVSVPPRDSKALIEAVTNLLKNPSKRDEIATAGHDFVTSYSWEDCTDQFEDALTEIVS